jgi:hypothetical protein
VPRDGGSDPEAARRQARKDIGLIVDASSGAAFRERIARDIPQYTAVAKAARIKFD